MFISHKDESLAECISVITVNFWLNVLSVITVNFWLNVYQSQLQISGWMFISHSDESLAEYLSVRTLNLWRILNRHSRYSCWIWISDRCNSLTGCESDKTIRTSSLYRSRCLNGSVQYLDVSIYPFSGVWCTTIWVWTLAACWCTPRASYWGALFRDAGVDPCTGVQVSRCRYRSLYWGALYRDAGIDSCTGVHVSRWTNNRETFLVGNSNFTLVYQNIFCAG